MKVFLVALTVLSSQVPAFIAQSDVDFGTCKELAVGSVTPLSKLQDLVADNVKVLSMTEQGFVFDGSDDLGNLLIRSLECDYISVDGVGADSGVKHIAHIGTPFDTSTFPASPFAAQGTTNGADFNNYIFAYLTDSEEYYNAMIEANVVGAGLATISYDDASTGDCLLERTVVVEPSNGGDGGYGYTAVATAFPDPSCAPEDTPYIANWWSSTNNGDISILSNQIPGQAAVFFNLSETTTTLIAMGDDLKTLFGGDNTTADSFGLGGFLPEVEDSPDMIITPLEVNTPTNMPSSDGDSMLIGAQTRPGSFWRSYPSASDVPEGCLVDFGTNVDDICCTADTEQGLRSDFTPYTCALLRGLLPDDPALGLVNYLNCEDGVEVYAEACYDGGNNGGIVPVDATFASSDVTDAKDCGTNGGCSFQVRGKGCWKIRNTNDLPGYEDQPGEVFIYLNEPSCEPEAVSDTPSPEEDPNGSGSAATALKTAVMVF
ncbi:MAG: hypothetical protein SGARI_000893, partial [Bacillariaceae sp.]